MGSKTAPSTRRRLKTQANKAKAAAKTKTSSAKSQSESHDSLTEVEKRLADEAEELQDSDDAHLVSLPDNDDDDLYKEMEMPEKPRKTSKNAQGPGPMIEESGNTFLHPYFLILLVFFIFRHRNLCSTGI